MQLFFLCGLNCEQPYIGSSQGIKSSLIEVKDIDRAGLLHAAHLSYTWSIFSIDHALHDTKLALSIFWSLIETRSGVISE